MVEGSDEIRAFAQSVFSETQAQLHVNVQEKVLKLLKE
jgi:hypothetical protein